MEGRGALELLQLKYFQIVAKNEHIARSAQQLNVSQPALSSMIARLEQELNVKLFSRIGRRIVLNEYGAVLLTHVNNILREEENAKLKIQEMSGSISRRLSVALTSPHLLDGIIMPFIASHPDIKLTLRVADLAKCAEMLKYGAVDFCVSAPGIKDDEIEPIVCVEDELVVAASCKHPFAQYDYVTINDIASERIIMLVGDFSFRHSVDEIFNRYGIHLNYYIECDHSLRNEFLKGNQGISISLNSAKKRSIYDEDICFVPIKAEHFPKITISICKQKGHYQTAISSVFMEQILKFYQHL